MDQAPVFFSQRKTTQEWLQALKGGEALVRRQAALALGQIGQPTAAVLRALKGALTDPNELVRRQAAESLGRMGAQGKAAAAALARALRDERDFVRQQAARTLGRLGPPARAAVPALVRTLKDPLKFVRWQACDSLGRIGTGARAAVKHLLEALHDAEEDVRSAAARALALIDCRTIGTLGRALRHRDSRIRTGAAFALGEMGGRARKAAPALRKALQDELAEVRCLAVRALAEIDPALSLPAFTSALQDSSGDVRREAAAALSQLGSRARPALPQILKAFDDADEQVRSWAVLAAVGVGKPAVNRLLRALRHKSPGVCAGAANALEEIGTQALGPKALPALVKALGSPDPLVRSWVARALAQYGPAAKTATQGLKKALKDDSEDVRLWAGKALEAIRGG